MSSEHWRMTLNNYLTAAGTAGTLTWETRKLMKGDEHGHLWEAIASINDVEYGRATSTTRMKAMDEAARQTLMVFRGH